MSIAAEKLAKILATLRLAKVKADRLRIAEEAARRRGAARL